MEIAHLHCVYVKMKFLSYWVCRHESQFRDNILIVNYTRFPLGTLQRLNTFMKKNNRHILKYIQQSFDFKNTSFILCFYNVNFQKCPSPRFDCKVKFLSTSPSFLHQFDLQNFSSSLHTSIFQHFLLDRIFFTFLLSVTLLLYMQLLN